MPIYELSVASGENSLDVRRFSVTEKVSELFAVSLWLRSVKHDIDLESIVGKPVRFVLSRDNTVLVHHARVWSGVCSHFEQQQAETTGTSSYYMRIVPTAWLLTQRTNYRIFQHMTIVDIVTELLAEWHITGKWNIHRGAYPELEYKVQYGESDYHFMVRLLQEAGIVFTFPNDADAPITFWDALHQAPPRAGMPLRYSDNPNKTAAHEYVSKVRITHVVKPGAYTIRDFSFRKPLFPLLGEAAKAPAPEARYELFDYRPGSFLVEPGAAADTPVADDKGIARYDQGNGDARAQRALEGERVDKRTLSFETNAIDLLPGVVVSIADHPHDDVGPADKLVVTAFSLQGGSGQEWSALGEAVFADVPYRPKLTASKPQVCGVQSATVVGPAGQEIHTDEFGRVRIEFPWQRLQHMDENSSCWVRVSQGWAGTGYGMINIPRIGQEVMVSFLNGDPDQPLIVGRVFNNSQPVPYKLPQHKTRSTWKTNSSPGGGGFNEIMFEDLAGSELVYLQAQKNLRKWVKNDEVITIGNDRQKLVKHNETETTGANRIEVTGANRTEITGANRTTVVAGSNMRQVGGSETVRTDGSMTVYVGGDQDVIIKQVKREHIGGDSHLTVMGKRNQRIEGTQSLTIGGDQHEKIGNSHALDTGKAIHLKAGTAVVIEAAQDLTLKGPGGFIRIDAGGVTIKGHVVKINSGGVPGVGAGSSPQQPDHANEATFELPLAPEVDDVSVTGLAQ